MAIMFGFSSVVLWTVERNSERRLQAEVELVARAVRLPLSASLEKNHEHTLQQVLESVLGVGRVYGATFTTVTASWLPMPVRWSRIRMRRRFSSSPKAAS